MRDKSRAQAPLMQTKLGAAKNSISNVR